MRIGIDISQIIYEGTGVGEYTRHLVENLLRIDRQNSYLLFGASLRRKNILESFARELKNQNLKFTTSFWLLPQTFTSEIWNDIHHVRIERLIGKIDIFHSSDWIQPPTKAKKVTTIHDLVVYKHPQSSHPTIIATQKRRLDWVKKDCDLIITDSQATKKDCQEILGIPARKMRVIPLASGSGYGQFAALGQKQKNDRIAEVKRKYHLDKKYILAIGTGEPRKNLDRLTQAYKSLNDANVDLVLAGKYGWAPLGGLRPEGERKVENGVKLLGYIPQEDLPALLAAAAVFAYPSVYEGFGIPILEAMTVGTPVVTSNTSSMPEVGGKAVIYVNPQNERDLQKKLAEVLKLSEKDRKIIIQEGYRQVKKFSWEKTAAETLKVYEELVPG